MSTYVKFYTIAFETPDGKVIKSSVKSLLNDISDRATVGKLKLKRDIDGKNVKMFKYYRDFTSPNKRFVVPFGINKQGVSYYENDDNELKEVDLELYDVNSLYFNEDENIILLTYDRPGPNFKTIQNYINDLIDSRFVVRIKPILYNTSIDTFRNSKQVRSVIISLNMATNVTELYNESVVEDSGILRSLSNLANETHNNLSNKTFQITLGLGHERKTTLDVRCVIDMLEKINIDSDCINEITVIYKDEKSENLEPVKLKDNDLELRYKFHLGGVNTIAPDYILNNAQTAIEAKRMDFAPKVREYFRNSLDADIIYEVLEE